MSVTGPGATVDFMPQSQACSHGSAMHQAAGIFLGEGLCSFKPCPTPLARLTLYTLVGGQLRAGCRSAVGGGWWCWSSALARTLRNPFSGGFCSGSKHGGGLSLGGPLLASSIRTLSGGAPALGAGACCLSTQVQGAAGRSKRAKPDGPGHCGHLNKTDDEAFCPGYFADLFQNLILRSVLFEFALQLAATQRA